MSKKIIIHIGTHKTGTTSIQRALAANRVNLKRQGILYPDYDLVGYQSHYAHIDMANGLSGKHPRFSQSDAEAFFTQVKKASLSYNATIISAESLYRQVISDKSPQSLGSAQEYWVSREKYVKKFREIIGPAEIHMVVRRQDEFAESMYQEQVKVTRYSKGFSAYLKDFWFHFDYLKQAKLWHKYFNNFHVVPFSSIQGPEITNLFMQKIGFKNSNLIKYEMYNKGIPHDGVIIKRMANESLLNSRRLNRIVRALESEEFRSSVHPEARSFFINEEEKKSFYKAYEKSNEELADFCGLEEKQIFNFSLSRDFLYGDTLKSDEQLRLLHVLEGLVPKYILYSFPHYTPSRTRIGFTKILKYLWKNKIR